MCVWMCVCVLCVCCVCVMCVRVCMLCVCVCVEGGGEWHLWDEVFSSTKGMYYPHALHTMK